MDVRLTLQTLHADESLPLTEDLLRWLKDEPELRGRVTVASAAPEPGQMSGGVLQTILVSLGSAGVGALARSLPIWLRLQRSKVEIEVTRADGRSVRVSTDNRKDVDSLIHDVLGVGLDRD
ncbi:hypothetical protein SBI_09717 [Streptomyces bingchenggensis BCW-1]|uniref:Uncharacterized protein n=1 Tax=Streptomyces bingchenggensis (strain BCW-1) TaxID=749414 RepID=D7CBF8_STRBB|nr:MULTISPECIES: hypothetical protein [Streptomyces]ADI12835.1 hypothetical protein SBI_09717 [Streptomyces bingchenggensis BCW-1]